MTFCPVCNLPEIKPEYQDYLDGHILMEQHLVCSRCGWSLYFVTGYEEEVIGDYVFYSSYHMTPEEAVLHEGLRQWAIEQRVKELNQENWDEFNYYQNVRR